MEIAPFLAKFLQTPVLRGTRHLARSRLSAPQQIDLFAAELQNAMGDMPAWSRLPTEIQAALIGLIIRLIREHADRSWLAQGRRPVMISDKIRRHHVGRKALLYRQSSICQALHHRRAVRRNTRCVIARWRSAGPRSRRSMTTLAVWRQPVLGFP
jgi:hypothetical protein